MSTMRASFDSFQSTPDFSYFAHFRGLDTVSNSRRQDSNTYGPALPAVCLQLALRPLLLLGELGLEARDAGLPFVEGDLGVQGGQLILGAA